MGTTRGRFRFWGLSPFVLFAVSAAWRFAYLARLRDTSLLETLNADSHVYWSWSGYILRHGLKPPAPFFLAPLYPYGLAILRRLGADGVSGVLAVQAVLGAIAVALLTDAAMRVAGRASGVAVGLLLAFGQSPTFFDGLVLPESLLFFLESVLVWLVVRTDWPRAGLSAYALYGLMVGVLSVGRASNAVLALLVIPLVWAGRHGTGRAKALVATGAAFALCCLPVTLANFTASRELIPLTYNLGFNLYVGNNPEADGTYVDVTGASMPIPLAGASPTTGGALDGRAFVRATDDRSLGAKESSRYWTHRALAFVSAHPLRAIGLAGRKLLLLCNARELPQIESMAARSALAGPLGLPVAGSFGVLAVLGLAGCVTTWRGSTTDRWLVGYVVAMSVSLLPFFVTDRYRHQLLPGLAVLAGIAVAEVARGLRGIQGAQPVRSGAAVLCATVLVFLPLEARDARLGGWAPTADLAIRLADRGRFDEAVVVFARAERALPPASAGSFSTSARSALASFYLRYGNALEALSRQDDAVVRWERAVAVNPNDAESLARLELAYERRGRADDAARARERLEAVPGGRGLMLLNDGWSAAGRGELDRAEGLFQEAAYAAPDSPTPWEGLVRIRIQTGRFDEAAITLSQARDAGLGRVRSDIYESFLAAHRGDLAAARRAIGRIPVEHVPHDATLSRLLAEARGAAEPLAQQ